MNTKLIVLFNPIYNKKRRTTPKYFLVWFPGNWVALKSLWKYQPWTSIDTLNPSYNWVLIWAMLAPDEWHLLALRMPSLWPCWTTLLFTPLCALSQTGQAHSKHRMLRDSLGQYSSKNNLSPTTVEEILQNLHNWWPQAHFHTVP